MLTNWGPKDTGWHSISHVIHQILCPTLGHGVSVWHLSNETVLDGFESVVISDSVYLYHLFIRDLGVVAAFSNILSVATRVERRNMQERLEELHSIFLIRI